MLSQRTWPSYRTFQSAVARDLCWLLSPQFDIPMPPSAYLPFTSSIGGDVVRWLRKIDQQPDLAQVGETSQNPLQQRRLGHYFEDLVAYSLNHKPGNSIYDLQRNVPLRQPSSTGKGTETVGELDFLFRQGETLQHLEVAVKFYLSIETPSGPPRWLGPNSKDSLERKWRRLLTHQLPLAQRFAQQEDILSHYWLKGILFQHWQRDRGKFDQTLFHWIHQHQLQEYFRCYPGQWYWLDKRYWLGAYTGEQPSLDPTALQKGLERHFDVNDYGLMLINASKKVEHRCFVVSDHWPHIPPD